MKAIKRRKLTNKEEVKIYHEQRTTRRVPRRRQPGGRRLVHRRPRRQLSEPGPFVWHHPGSVLRRSFGTAYALATARRDQDGRVIRIPGYHTRGRSPADLVINILASHGGFQEAVLCAAEPFSQRRSDRQALRLSNEWLQPEFPSPDLEDPAEPEGAYAIYLHLTYGPSLEDEEQGRTFGERLYLQMGRVHEGSTVYGWCELCSVPLRVWRNCQTCFEAFFSDVGRDASQALDCGSDAHQQDLQCFVCADCQQWM